MYTAAIFACAAVLIVGTLGTDAQSCTPGSDCFYGQSGCGYCLCMGRSANDFGIGSYTISAQTGGAAGPFSITTGYYGTLDARLTPEGQTQAILRMTMFVNSVDTDAIAIGLHSISNVTLPSGPGPISFVYNDQGYFSNFSPVVGKLVFFQSEFFDSNGVRLSCLRTDDFIWPAIPPYPPTLDSETFQI